MPILQLGERLRCGSAGWLEREERVVGVFFSFRSPRNPVTRFAACRRKKGREAELEAGKAGPKDGQIEWSFRFLFFF